jgi:ADP-ribose pyrophosphatase
MALAGEIVNGASVGGILAAQAVRTSGVEPRPTDAPWEDLPTRFPSRQD